jgi:acetolactate synthase I/II/III large subunit
VPVLFLPGGEPSARQGIAPTFSARDNYAHVTKWATYVSDPRRLAPALRHAFYRLRTGKGGPVLVETATDALFGELDGELHYQPVSGSRFAPDSTAVNAAVEALASAQRPRAARRGRACCSPRRADELVALAEALDAPVITTMPGKSAFPENHPLSAGASAITKPPHLLAAYRDADCVFAIGSSLTRTVYGTNVPTGKVMIQATVAEEDVNKEYAIDHALVGDARLTLAGRAAGPACAWHSARAWPSSRGAAEGKAGISGRVAGGVPRRRSADQPVPRDRRHDGASGRRPDHHHPRCRHAAGADHLVLAGAGAAQLHRLGQVHSARFRPGRHHGAKLAEPDKVCINVMGDAAIGMVGMDIETAVRNRIGIVTVIFNNGIMAIESDSLVDAHTEYGANFVGGNYAALAESLGAVGERVVQPADFIPALDRAMSATREGRPAVIEVMAKAGYRWPGRPQSLD